MRLSKTLVVHEKLTSKGTVFYKNIWYKLFYMFHIYIILTINFLYYNLIVTTRDGVYVWIHVHISSFLSFFFHAFSAFWDNYHYSRIVAALFTHCSSIIHALWQYYSRIVHGTHSHFIQKKILKMSPTILFTLLKIILLQCFQFSVSTKISCIQTDLEYLNIKCLC